MTTQNPTAMTIPSTYSTSTRTAHAAMSAGARRTRPAARNLTGRQLTPNAAARVAARPTCARRAVAPPSAAVRQLAQPIDMTPTPYLQRVRNYVATHGFSRDGAIAAVLAAGTTRRAMSLVSRLALFVLGTVTIGSAVGVMLWNNIGPGPLDVFIGGVRRVTGLPLMLAFWVTIAGVLVFATALGRRPGLGSFAGPLIIAPVVQTVAAVLPRSAAPTSIPLQLVVHLLAIAAIGIGAGSMIVSGLGAGSGELLASAASDRSGRPEPRVRMVFEATWLGIGFVLGGPIGWGTVVVALMIGPAVATGTKVVSQAVSHARRTATSAVAVAFAAA